MQPNTSPLEHLAAFAIAFVAGILSATSVVAYARRMRRLAVVEHYENARKERNLMESRNDSRSIWP